MYQEVYIDVVFAANFLMDYILLRLIGRLMRLRQSRGRCLAGAGMGALFSSLILCVSMENRSYLSILLNIACAVGMLYLAYRIPLGKTMAAAVALFGGLTFLIGGFWEYIVGEHGLSGAYFLLCALGIYGVLSACMYAFDHTEVLSRNKYPIRLKYRGKEVQTYGFYDTGNLLTDPYSGAPVSIASPEILKALCTGISLEKLINIMKTPEELESTEIADLKPRYLFIRTVGQGERMILAVTLENLCIQTPKAVIHIAAPVFALSQEPFALGEEYEVLLNSRLLH